MSSLMDRIATFGYFLSLPAGGSVELQQLPVISRLRGVTQIDSCYLFTRVLKIYLLERLKMRNIYNQCRHSVAVSKERRPIFFSVSNSNLLSNSFSAMHNVSVSKYRNFKQKKTASAILDVSILTVVFYNRPQRHMIYRLMP